MIEITLLKVKHASEGEAKKLLPFVLESNVWGLEAFGCSGKDAEKYENYFHDAYTLSRTEFQRWTRECGSFGINEMKEYNAKLYDYLFRNKRTVYALERFPSDEKSKMESDLCKCLQLGQKSLEHLDDGDIKSFLHHSYLSLAGMAMSRMKRDRNMATNLDNAEDYLRERYPKLKEHSTIKLIGGIGIMHSPENYMHSPTKVIELIETGIADSVVRKFNQHVRRGVKIEDRDLLVHAISLKGDKRFSNEELLNMDFESLIRKYQS